MLAWHATLAPHSQGSELRRSAIVRAVQQARPSIVNINGEKTLQASFNKVGKAEPPRRVNGMGTGIVVDPRGYILTNHHVVHGVRRIQVTLADGSSHFARIVSHDEKTDLAIVKINPQGDLPVIRIGTSADLMPGETVIAVGNAYGYEHTVTQGIISALHRTVQVSDSQQYEDLIQTDASINPGNSGGPLLNIDGEMIGVNVAVRAGAQGIGFAIPVDRALEICSDLLDAQKVDNHWHGLETESARGSHPGAHVKRVEPNSPAEKAGVKHGDLITSVGDYQLSQPLDFHRAMLSRKVGEEIALRIRRDNQPMTLSLILAHAPAYRPSTQDMAWEQLGLRIAAVSPEKFRRLNSRYRGGLRVEEVREDSPAGRQGIQAGDILVGMHIWETVSLDNLAYVLKRPDLAELQPLKFYIVRGDETLFGYLRIAAR